MIVSDNRRKINAPVMAEEAPRSRIDMGPRVLQTADTGKRRPGREDVEVVRGRTMTGPRLTLAIRVGMIVLAMVPAGGTVRAREVPARRPNVVIILADDLGFSDLGCYGGEIRTPRLDGLAAGGLRFTQFYNTARCWPSRAAILTGYYAQQVRRDVVSGVKSGSAGHRPPWAKLLPERLRALGYRSYHSGKWHVDGMPLAGGFDRSYYVEDLGRYFHPRVLFEDDRKLPPVAPGSGYYSTAAMADHAIGYLAEHATRHGDRPFFVYLAFSAPHFPLQAPPEDIARYRGRYDEGWEAVRATRWGRIQELGLVHGRLSDVERDVGPPYPFPMDLERLGPGEVNRPLPWKSLTAPQRGFQAAKMEIHAAMVDRMDREIGRVLDQIRAMGAWDDTLILFLSDNGASAEIMVRDDGHDPAAPAGSAASHLCLGPGWSSVANTPFRRHKTWVHEGGIATPLIAHWPRAIAARGELRHDPGHVIDLVPTILAAAGARESADPPVTEAASGRAAPPRPGKSLLPAFARDGSVAHEAIWWEHEGNRAIRVGDWKLVAARGGRWELYDLAADRTETRDLATAQPDRVRELAARWQRMHDEFAACARADPP
jgi:arylsulfatase A-like enzyme